MKKILFALALCSVVASMTVSVAAEAKANAPEATIKPDVTDGVIDEVWGNADRMYGEIWGGDSELNPEFVNSYASVMWDAEGVYLLAVVYDKTIPTEDIDARNSVDWWISETYSDDTEYLEDGDWHICQASTGERVYYTGNESVYDEGTFGYKVYDDYYVAECFMPWQTVGFAPAIGTEIGFTVSFNDDHDVDGVRDVYTHWYTTEEEGGSGAYWSETMALPKIQFVAGPEVPADDVVEPDVDVDAPVDTPVTADAGIVAAAAIMAVAAGVVLSKKH